MNKVWTKTLLTLTLLVVFGLAYRPSPAQAASGILDGFLADKNIDASVSADVAFYDKYIWRGFRLDGDPSVQPDFTISVGPIEGGWWGNEDVSNTDSLSSNESDGWIGYNFDLGFINEDLKKVGFSVGNTWYGFPGTNGYSKESFVTVSVDTLLSPSFTWYHDYGKESQGGGNGDYYVFSGGHSFTLDDQYGITLDISEELGINHKAFIVGTGGWSTTTVGLTIPLTDHVTLTPNMSYTSPFSDLSSSSDGAQNDEFWGGVSVSFSS